jgi:hypothetical protein
MREPVQLHGLKRESDGANPCRSGRVFLMGK